MPEFYPLDYNLWFTEEQTRNQRLSLRIKKVLYSGNSRFQKVAVLETAGYGNLLVLDGAVMTTELDEHIYHEMISHPALFVHPRPEHVLIIGGGDGGTAREVVKHPTIKSVDLCEIDAKVIEVSKKYLPTIAAGFKNRKVHVMIKDGIRYMATTKKKYDVVIVDSSDPFGPAEGLIDLSFYRNVKKVLNKNGIFVSQTESPFAFPNTVKKIYGSLRRAFPVTKMYTAAVPTYPGGLWSFCFCSQNLGPVSNFDPKRFKKSRYKTKYYNEKIHSAAFCLPTQFRKYNSR